MAADTYFNWTIIPKKTPLVDLFPFAENLEACFEDEGVRGTPP